MIRRISRRRVGTGFSFSQQTPTLHRSLSFFFLVFFVFFQTTVLQDGFVLQDWNALTQHDESTGEAANLKQWRDVTQPKNAISMPPEKPSSPPSLHPSLSFLHFFISSASFYWGGIWWFQLFCQKTNLFSFFFFLLAQTKQKRTGGGRDMKPTSPAAFDATHLGGSLGDDMISLSLQPSSSDNQPP